MHVVIVEGHNWLCATFKYEMKIEGKWIQDENILNIILTNGPTTVHRIGKDDEHGGGLHDKIECFFKVNARLLKKTFDN